MIAIIFLPLPHLKMVESLCQWGLEYSICISCKCVKYGSPGYDTNIFEG